jgi:hypothetical protein
MWQLQALGGSGHYVWTSQDPEVARVSERARVWSRNVGKTILRVQDLNNEHNYATIPIETALVNHLSWLEDRLEAQKATESALLSAIALDQEGRKFTNCTSLGFAFEVKGDGVATEESTKASWDVLQSYIQGNEGLRLA